MKGDEKNLYKQGQLKLSFGMIFSIILIIIFIAFAFYAIKIFLGMQDEIKIGQFTNDLQLDINSMWEGSGSQEVEYSLPSKIESVCFTDDEYENLIYHSKNFILGKKIDNINITKITEEGDFCIDNIKGKVKMIIKKDYGEALVTITRQ